MKYTTKNNLEMLKCYPLNWRVEKKYAITHPGEVNPEFYVINIGSLSDMWQVAYIPETMIVSFHSMHYSNHEVYKFKVDNIEQASLLAMMFAEGMNQVDNLRDTIHWILNTNL